MGCPVGLNHRSQVINSISEPEKISVCWINSTINEKSGPHPQNGKIWNGPCHFFANVTYSREWIWCGDASASDHGMTSADFYFWRIIALQCCGGLCYTPTWVSHNYVYIYIYIFLLSWVSLLCPIPPSRLLKKKKKLYFWFKPGSNMSHLSLV